MNRHLTGLFLSAFAAAAAFGQSSGARLEFEVASVKPSAPPQTSMGPGGMTMFRIAGGPPSGGPGTKDPTRYKLTGATVSSMLMTAYGVKKHQIAGPPILDSERFDVIANVPLGASKEDVAIMLQNLLADRFKLTLHHEQKEMPMYDLVAGKGPLKLTESAEDAPVSGDAPPPPPPPPGDFRITMGKDGMPVMPAGPGRGGSNMMVMNGNARLTAKKETMDSFATRLAGQLAKPVNNSTGLTAKYDFVATWSTEGLPGRGGMPGMPGMPGGGGMAIVAQSGGGGEGGPQKTIEGGDAVSAPNIFAAVQALGLKLEAKKGMVDVLVVDHMEKVPTEN